MARETIGIFLLLMGVIFLFGKRLPFVGNLPGDIYLHGKNYEIFLPLGTFILAGIIFSLLLRLFAGR